jgi:hypothetical protein
LARKSESACPFRHISKDFCDGVPDYLEELAAQRKLMRIAAFRQLQAISHALFRLTGSMSLETFAPLDQCLVGPVEKTQSRIVHDGVPSIVDTETQVIRPVLPPGFSHSVGLLVVGLDQGSIGAAGMAFGVTHLGYQIYPKFDKLHRVIRDVKGAMTQCMGGIFMKAQLFSSYIYGLNYRPFGSGAFWQTKRLLANTFLQTHDYQSALFQKYAERIARDLGMECGTESSDFQLYETALEADSLHKKGSYPKLGRWFSWNGVVQEQLQEFFTVRMLLEANLDAECGPEDDADAAFHQAAILEAGVTCSLVSASDVGSEQCGRELSLTLVSKFGPCSFLRRYHAYTDTCAMLIILAHRLPDQTAGRASSAREELKKLKDVSGGLLLAFKLMSTDLHWHIKALWKVMQPIWRWYTDQVKGVKTPQQGAKAAAELAGGQWRRDPHLWNLIHTCMYDRESHTFMDLTTGNCERAVQLMLHFLAKRAWTMTRHSIPPEDYANILTPGPAAEAACVRMRSHWKCLVVLEQRRHSSRTAESLWLDLGFARSMPVLLSSHLTHLFDWWPLSSRISRGNLPFLG